jgi:hypothetical protein
MPEIEFKHHFRVESDKFIWEDSEMFEYYKRKFEGRRGYAVFFETIDDPTPNQYAYYFGGIIRKECMQSETFAGWTEKEIHMFLLKEILGTLRQVKFRHGPVKTISVAPDFNQIGKRGMADYISKLIPYLQVEFDIHPKPAEHYKYNKFYIKK